MVKPVCDLKKGKEILGTMLNRGDPALSYILFNAKEPFSVSILNLVLR